GLDPFDQRGFDAGRGEQFPAQLSAGSGDRVALDHVVEVVHYRGGLDDLYVRTVLSGQASGPRAYELDVVPTVEWEAAGEPGVGGLGYCFNSRYGQLAEILWLVVGIIHLESKVGQIVSEV